MVASAPWHQRTDRGAKRQVLRVQRLEKTPVAGPEPGPDESQNPFLSAFSMSDMGIWTKPLRGGRLRVFGYQLIGGGEDKSLR